MTLKDEILRIASTKRTFRTGDVLGTLARKVSRQHVSATLRKLVGEGGLVKTGSTRGAAYALPKYAHYLQPTIKRRLRNRNLREDED